MALNEHKDRERVKAISGSVWETGVRGRGLLVPKHERGPKGRQNKKNHAKQKKRRKIIEPGGVTRFTQLHEAKVRG